MGITGAKRAVITDDATGTAVELRLLSQESEFSLEGVGNERPDGSTAWVQNQAEISLAFYDDSEAVSQLKAWQEGYTPLTAVVIGIEDYIFWDKPSTILVSEPVQFTAGNRNARVLSMRARDDQQQIARDLGYELQDNNDDLLEGFIGYNETDTGITARTLQGATFGSEGTFTWTIDGTDYVMETVTMNTLN